MTDEQAAVSIAAQLEDEQDQRRGGGVHRGVPAATPSGRRGRRRRRSARPSRRCRRWSTARAGSRVRVGAQNMHEAGLRRLHRRGLRADAARARRRRRRARALRAAPVLRRDRRARSRARCRRRSTPACCRSCAWARPRRSARRGRPSASCATRCRRTSRQVDGDAPARGRDRLRADLGDRHRQDRHAGAGAGGDRASCARCVGDRDARGRRARADPLRRQRERRQRGGAAGPAGRRRRARRRREPRPGPSSRRSSRPPRPMSRCPAADLPLPSRSWSSTAGGSRRPGPGNAISLADTPVFDELWARYPHTQLDACGRAVGLPAGPDGQLRGRPPEPRRRHGREAGPRPHRRGDRGRRASSRTRRCAARARRRASAAAALHLIGLVSDGGVHSSLGHLQRAASSWPRASASRRSCCTRSPTAATRCRRRRRSTSRRRRRGSRERRGAGVPARIGTVMGRYWGMDRDRRWDRTKRAYDAIVHARGPDAPRARRTRSGRPTGATRPTSSSSRRSSASPRRCAPATACSRSTSAPTGCARSCARSGEPDFAEFDRGGVPGVARSRR